MSSYRDRYCQTPDRLRYHAPTPVPIVGTDGRTHRKQSGRLDRFVDVMNNIHEEISSVRIYKKTTCLNAPPQISGCISGTMPTLQQKRHYLTWQKINLINARGRMVTCILHKWYLEDSNSLVQTTMESPKYLFGNLITHPVVLPLRLSDQVCAKRIMTG